MTERLRGVAARVRTWLRGLSLRTRLLAVTMALAAIGLTVAGVVTYSSLKAFLVDRVDAQLKSAQRPALDYINDFVRDEQFAPAGPGGRGFGGPGALPQGVKGGLYTSDGRLLYSLGTTPASLFSGQGSGYSTVSLRSLGSYRVLTGSATTDAFGHLRIAENGEFRFAVAVPLGDVNSTLTRLVIVEVLVGLLVLAAIGGAGYWLVRVGLRPLTDIEHTASAIADGDLSQRIDEAPPRTEVGRLGHALNTMLGKIEGAFAERTASERRLRQFVADASHELQTPLTSVRGYAELFRRGAAERPEDLANAMHRIEAESERMGVLVDDLLLLARLDQGRPMERAPVDLAGITRELVGDARVVDPDRTIEFEAPGSVVVEGDEQRLRQIVSNLLSNARVHTPPGTSVSVRVAREGTEAILEVADRGHGMPADHAERVFERFFRADKSRARASGGSGLGLSIVAAIADAHGGRVSVETSPGDGACFRVSLPALGAGAAPAA